MAHDRAKQGPHADPPGMDALIDQWQAVLSNGAKPDYAKNQARMIRRLSARLGIVRPADITREALERHVVDLRRDGLSPKTIKNRMVGISTFCTFCAERGLLAENQNPARGLKLPRVIQQPPRYLTEAECQELLILAKGAGVYNEVALALLSGLRMTELRMLLWADVDLDRRVLIVRNTKNGRWRAVPITQDALAVLADQRKTTGATTYVFAGFAHGWGGLRDWPRGEDWWRKALDAIRQEFPAMTRDAGKQSCGRGWHLLRHSYCTRLCQAGVSPFKVMAWAGHSDIKMTMQYAHAAQAYDADAEAGGLGVSDGK